MQKVYLAARYSRRLELCGYRAELQALGFDVTARWLNGEHQIANDGTPIGEQGEALVKGTLRPGEHLSPEDMSLRAATLRTQFATEDFRDVSGAQIVICFTEPPRSKPSRGGRHVELGIALGRGAKVIVVGHQENIFCWLPGVLFFHNWEACLSALRLALRASPAPFAS